MTKKAAKIINTYKKGGLPREKVARARLLTPHGRVFHPPESHGNTAVDRVGVRRDDVVGADVDGVPSLGGGAVLGRAGGG
eukprot:scaffold3266_cov53-Phaeocystis_antarctica.AAC.3